MEEQNKNDFLSAYYQGVHTRQSRRRTPWYVVEKVSRLALVLYWAMIGGSAAFLVILGLIAIL